MTSLQAIRKFCIQCVGSSKAVHDCCGDQMMEQGDKNKHCLFYPFRKGIGRPSIKIIRKNCLECMGGSYQLVKECVSVECPVHALRLGKYPIQQGLAIRK